MNSTYANEHANELAPSGLPGVGDVPPGTRACHMFCALEDAFDVVAAYFAAGIARDERCVWFVGGAISADRARRALTARLADYAHRERQAQIEIVDLAAGDGEGRAGDGEGRAGDGEGRAGDGEGRAGDARDPRQWLARIGEEARARGFAGLRASADAAAESWPCAGGAGGGACARLVSDLEALVLCQFSARGRSAPGLVDSLGHHAFALRRRGAEIEPVWSATRLAEAIESARGGGAGAPDVGPDPRAQLERATFALAEARALADLAAAVGGPVRAALGEDAVSVTVAADVDGDLRPVAGASPDTGAAPIAAAADAHRSGPLWLEGDREIAARYGSLGEAKALASLPLRARGRRLGAIAIVYGARRRLDAPARAVVWDVARHLAAALDRALARERAEDERRRAERASESKDAFLAMLGHELRNPLAAIKNAAEVLGLQGAGAKRERAQAVIERQAAHMTELIDGLLDVSRIVRGKIDLAPEPLELGALVREAIEGRASAIERRGVVLETRLTEDELWIRGDRVRMTQIVDNLLANAIDFTSAGGTIAVTARPRGDAAVVEIRDTGAGIPGDLLPHVFEPFQQGSRARGRERGGLGLGLAVVKSLVELHGGHVAAASDGADLGARFAVTLPLSEPAAPRARPGAEPPAAAPRRVLIVEDHADAAQALADVLRAVGHRAAVARDGEDAIRETRRFAPDVVFCDIDLPGALSGHDVARALRAERPDAPILLVALSGYGRKEDVRSAMQAGFQAHLTKPVALEAAEAVLARADAPPRRAPRATAAQERSDDRDRDRDTESCAR